MISKALRAFVMIPCASLILGAFALQAAPVTSEKLDIPFEFQVQKHVLPAGEYQIQQANGSNIAVLVNTKTNERAQFIRPANTHEEGKARLVFVDGESRRFLKNIF